MASQLVREFVRIDIFSRSIKIRQSLKNSTTFSHFEKPISQLRTAPGQVGSALQHGAQASGPDHRRDRERAARPSVDGGALPGHGALVRGQPHQQGVDPHRSTLRPQVSPMQLQLIMLGWDLSSCQGWYLEGLIFNKTF